MFGKVIRSKANGPNVIQPGKAATILGRPSCNGPIWLRLLRISSSLTSTRASPSFRSSEVALNFDGSAPALASINRPISGFFFVKKAPFTSWRCGG